MPLIIFIFTIQTTHMFRIFQFVKKEQEYLHVAIPKQLRGKLVEIVVQEKAPDPDLKLEASEEQELEQKAKELQAIDQLRNQLNGWDIR